MNRHERRKMAARMGIRLAAKDGERVAHDLPPDVAESETFSSLAFWVDSYGARAAGWLAWKHRERLHAVGEMRFHILATATTPPWFRVAVEMFKRRAARWHVTELEDSTLARVIRRVYVVRWLGWRGARPPVLLQAIHPDKP